MLAAFMLPSASPVPTRLWTSSMKRMTLPSAFTSSTRPLMRLSNWPRNWVPATSAVKSSSWTSLSRSLAGTSPRAMRKARPSATAVLPTPGSPIRQGLFLVRRERICTTRWISFSRPMMLSSWPFRALAVKSVQKFWMCLRFFLWKLSFFCWTPAPPKPPFSPLLVGDAHFLHNIVDRLDPQLLGADQAEPLGVLAVHAVGDKDHGRAFLAACTKQHKRFVPFSQFNAARGGFPWKLCPMVGIGLHTGPVFYLTRQSWPECEEAVK